MSDNHIDDTKDNNGTSNIPTNIDQPNSSKNYPEDESHTSNNQELPDTALNSYEHTTTKQQCSQKKASTHTYPPFENKDEVSFTGLARKKKDSNVLFKLATISCICIAFLVGLAFIENLVTERKRYHRSAITEIKKIHASDQKVVTPFIVVPQTKTYTCTKFIKEKNITISNQICTKEIVKVITPESSKWQHDVKVSDKEHHIGIYNAISYNDALDINSTFILDNKKSKVTTEQDTISITNKSAKLILSVSDLKSVAEIPHVIIDGKKHQFRFPQKQQYFGLNYVELDLPKKFLQSGLKYTVPMNFKVKFKGIDSLSTLPLGNNVQVSMQADWADPKFFGMTSQNKKITKQGFQANWFNTYQSIANTQKLTSCSEKSPLASCDFIRSADNSFGVQFIKATNTYTQTDRTIKYALLLLMVVFGAFFLFEVTKGLRIHPIQYSLVGAALLVFYVLLLSLSEQIAFSSAYLIAAIGCVGLISWYVSHVLKSVTRAAIFAGILSTLYGCFFFIIQSQDNSLIIGSVFMFVMVALAMFVTRKIDWYGQ